MTNIVLITKDTSNNSEEANVNVQQLNSVGCNLIFVYEEIIMDKVRIITDNLVGNQLEVSSLVTSI